MIDTATATIPETDAPVESLPFSPVYGAWPDRASICHPSPSGKGSAIRFELHPARGRVPGHIFVEVARQKSVASVQGEVPSFATFDWENKICCKMGLGDLAQMVMVFRGMQESIQDGKGLFHRSAKANTVIKFSHQTASCATRISCSVPRRPCGSPRRSRPPWACSCSACRRRLPRTCSDLSGLRAERTGVYFTESRTCPDCSISRPAVRTRVPETLSEGEADESRTAKEAEQERHARRLGGGRRARLPEAEGMASRGSARASVRARPSV